MSIGEQIKKLRTAKKLTQSDLAERINVTKATISAYENETRQPSYDILIKLAQLFHVSTDNILGYSSKYFIDVSALNQYQRNVVSEIVGIYMVYNNMVSSDTPRQLNMEDMIMGANIIENKND